MRVAAGALGERAPESSRPNSAWGAGRLIHPLRVALTGQAVSPGSSTCCTTWAGDLSLDRIGRALETLAAEEVDPASAARTAAAPSAGGRSLMRAGPPAGRRKPSCPAGRVAMRSRPMAGHWTEGRTGSSSPRGTGTAARVSVLALAAFTALATLFPAPASAQRANRKAVEVIFDVLPPASSPPSSPSRSGVLPARPAALCWTARTGARWSSSATSRSPRSRTCCSAPTFRPPRAAASGTRACSTSSSCPNPSPADGFRCAWSV